MQTKHSLYNHFLVHCCLLHICFPLARYDTNFPFFFFYCQKCFYFIRTLCSNVFRFVRNVFFFLFPCKKCQRTVLNYVIHVRSVNWSCSLKLQRQDNVLVTGIWPKMLDDEFQIFNMKVQGFDPFEITNSLRVSSFLGV